MKSFPNQKADLVELARSLQALLDLHGKGDEITALEFGREITRRQIRWPRGFPDDGDIEAYMSNSENKAKHPTSSSHGAAARGILELFRHLGLCDEEHQPTGLGMSTVEKGYNASDRLFKKHWHWVAWDLEHEGSHPYRHLLRIVKNNPGIKSNILAMCLEAKDDGKKERERVDNIVKKMLNTDNAAQRVKILNEEGVECSLNSFNNAAKVLPGIAKQLGDIRIENRTDVYPVDRVAPNNTMNDLIASEWVQETKSWFRQKGLGANHEHAKIEREHPAPFSFQDVGRLIRFFTKEGESVIDPFCGVGSTNKAAALDGRNSTGIELSQKWVDLCHKRMEIEVGGKADDVDTEFITGDSSVEVGKLVEDGRLFQFLVTSPPYWSILNKKADHKVKQMRLAEDLATNYSEDEEDLGNIDDYEYFLDKLTEILLGCWNLLDHGRYAAVIVSDFRHGSKYYPFHAHLIDRLTDENVPNHFELQGLKVLLQTHKRLFPYGYPTTYVENIHHQYIIILRKPKKRK